MVERIFLWITTSVNCFADQFCDLFCPALFVSAKLRVNFSKQCLLHDVCVKKSKWHLIHLIIFILASIFSTKFWANIHQSENGNTKDFSPIPFYIIVFYFLLFLFLSPLSSFLFSALLFAFPFRFLSFLFSSFSSVTENWSALKIK